MSLLLPIKRVTASPNSALVNLDVWRLFTPERQICRDSDGDLALLL